MSNGLIIVVVVIAGVVIFLIFDAFGRWIASLGGACVLKKSMILKDACVGGCLPGQRCVALTTRPYFLFGTQAATCGCVPVGTGGTPVTPPPGLPPLPPGPTPSSGGSGGGSTASDD
ncbi:hypothetical protein [Sedimentitalea xiamensis]|uniref:hypothetical protein n=1 Tax=Sedimentitalea xiamensis TaxID=3050037 RepID=UPI002542106A|nr:hypothetical protein [Sedimentitalea xiamensis]